MPATLDEFQAAMTTERWAFIEDAIRGGLRDYADPAFYSDAARRDHNRAFALPIAIATSWRELSASW